MVQFDPNTLYSLAELEEQLKGVVELPTLIARLGLKDRIFRDAVFGFEVLEKAKAAEPFHAAGKSDAAILPISPAARGTGRGRSGGGPTRRLGAKDLK